MAEEDPPQEDDRAGAPAGPGAAADVAAPEPEMGTPVAALAGSLDDLDGYCVVGPGPADRPRLSWTARRAAPDRYFIDEAFGGAPRLTIGPLPVDEVTGFIATRAAEARGLYETTLRRFDRQPSPAIPVPAAPRGSPHDDLRERLTRWQHAAASAPPAKKAALVLSPEVPLPDQTENTTAAEQAASPSTDEAPSLERDGEPRPTVDGGGTTDMSPSHAVAESQPWPVPTPDRLGSAALQARPLQSEPEARSKRGFVPSLLLTVVGSVGARTTGMLRARAAPAPLDQRQDPDPFDQEPGQADVAGDPAPRTASANEAASGTEEVVAATLRAIQDLLAKPHGDAD